MSKPTKATNKEKIAYYELQSANWLATGNESSERGDKAYAEECYAKSTRYLQLANRRIEDGK